ncbi:MAG TPA: hypothetical protein VFW21_10855 [Mycobacterium sp.]|nr:hypothetical protein [Mycobacterium sp.]
MPAIAQKAGTDLHSEITVALARVRAAREAGDTGQQSLSERRLDWLLSRLPRKR